jgi:hypothetical protein
VDEGTRNSEQPRRAVADSLHLVQIVCNALHHLKIILAGRKLRILDHVREEREERGERVIQE